jgi:hypothetical protein
LKYRFTYPEACQSEARQRLEAMIQELPWATAQHGAAADEPQRGPVAVPPQTSEALWLAAERPFR